MLDKWWGDGGWDIVAPSDLICMGSDVYVPSMSDIWFSPFEKCVFLENDRCILHDKKLKPSEGRKAIHINVKESEEQNELHTLVGATWNTPKGREVVQLWKSLYYKEKES